MMLFSNSKPEEQRIHAAGAKCWQLGDKKGRNLSSIGLSKNIP